jgi:hypothetical protein
MGGRTDQNFEKTLNIKFHAQKNQERIVTNTYLFTWIHSHEKDNLELGQEICKKLLLIILFKTIVLFS